MNFRFSAALFGIILVVVVALLVRSFFAETQETGSLLPDLRGVKADQIDVVELEKTDPPGILKLERRGKEWVIAEPIQAKADPTLVTSLITALLKAKPTVFSQRIPAFSTTGLQPPSLKVTLRQSNERSGTLNFGNVTYGKPSSVFVSTSTTPDRAIAIGRSEVDPLFRDSNGDGKSADLVKWVADFRLKTIFPSEPNSLGDDISLLKLSLPNKKKELALSHTGGGWKFEVPAGWGNADVSGDQTASTPHTFTGVRPLLMALTSIKALNADDFKDNPGDLKAYGLNADNPDLVRVEMVTRDGPTIVYLGKSEMGASPATPNAPPSSKIWVRIEGQAGVIRANANDLSGLVGAIENPDPLRDRNLLAANKDQIDGIDLTVGGQTTKLRRTGSGREWKLYGNPAAGDPQNPNLPALTKLIDTLAAQRTIRSFPPVNPANFAPGEIKAEVKVWSDGFTPAADPKAEPTEKGKPTTLVFGKKEGDLIYVNRKTPEGTMMEFTVPDKIKLLGSTGDESADLLKEIATTRLDLLDPNLKTFAPSVVNKISVTGTRTYVLDREEKKDTSSALAKERWIFAEPADQKGKVADTETVSEVLRLLGTTHSVSRFVNETPTPQNLVEYGLSPPPMATPGSPPSPRLKVVIGLQGTEPTEKERVYEFGVTSGDSVYARQAGKQAVFLLPKFLVDKLVNADLRDRSIFQFDAAQITGLEFEGWKGITGTRTKLKFEKSKDGTWKAIEPASYMVDPKKIEDFLNTLKGTNVTKFLPGSPSLEQGFGDEKIQLVIVLSTAAGPLISLNIGGPAEEGKAYYMWTSILPQTAPVFLVDAARFKMYKESPGVFAK